VSAARRLVFLLFLSGTAFLAQAQVSFPPPVAQALAAAKIPAAGAAALVQEVGATRASLNVNPAAPMNPASVMKLVTTYAALELLGPAYRWKTEAYTTGPVRDGALEGDLVLKGYGDPKLDLEAFWILLRALRGKGLRDIRGDLVLDRSHFERAPGDAGRFDGDAFRPYNVLPDALLVNFKSLRFAFVPEPERGAVRLYVEPRPPALEVVNVLRLTEGACPEGQAFRDLLKPTFEAARQRALFSGQYPASCGEKDLNVALLEPNDHVAGMMRQLWAEMGGTWTGVAREGPVPPGARLLHAMDSAPLAEIVRDTNKFSNNVMARHLYLTLGAESAGPPANSQKAAAAIKAWIARKGIAAPELIMENGSGLSRIERISAANLANLLQAAWRSPVMPEFIASMPVAAVDGTMRRRLLGSGVAGQAHIKTGLLSDARAMAGYVLDRGGRRHVVVMFVNHASAHETQPAMDALLRWVYEGAR
jgi:D-alanyl-D-alanine carboxypeptidase/D-alanyl-D-alanine-endopeptidase (penicillin-binding protein 4)